MILLDQFLNRLGRFGWRSVVSCSVLIHSASGSEPIRASALQDLDIVPVVNVPQVHRAEAPQVPEADAPDKPLAAAPEPANSQSPTTSAPSDADATIKLDGPKLSETPTWSETIRAVVLTAIPDQYQDLRHWGKTREIFDGFRVQQRGFDIRVSERKRKVNDGAWHQYKIELVDPAKTLKLVIVGIEPRAFGRFQFQIRLAAKLRCRADFEHWVLGVKGFNVSTVSEADVEMIAHCEVIMKAAPNPSSLIPDTIIEPQVNRVELFLRHLDTQRIGAIRGDLAKGIGDVSRHEIENLLQAQEPRVTRKANEAIEKNRNRLKLPTSRIW